MPFQVSPGVNTSEIDLTNVVVAAGTSVGGFAGRFHWGPIEEVTLVTDEDNLVDQFRKPDDNNYEHFFTAANFLSYTNALNLVRAANRHSMGRPSPIPGLRQRHDLLAASARLECRWCLGAAAPSHADSLA